MAPSLLDRTKDGPFSIFWKSARIGERLSPYVSILCFVMAVSDSFDMADLMNRSGRADDLQGYYLVGGA